MAATQEEIVAGLAEIVNEIAGIPTEDVQLDKSFTDDLDVDSLSMVEVVVAAEERFDRVFVQKDAPEEMPQGEFAAGGEAIWIVRLLQEADLVASASEGRRLIKQGAVSIDGERIDDVDYELDLGRAGEMVIKVGKRRFFKVIVSQQLIFNIHAGTVF